MVEIKLWNEKKRAHLKFSEKDAALIEKSIEKMFDFMDPQEEVADYDFVIVDDLGKDVPERTPLEENVTKKEVNANNNEVNVTETPVNVTETKKSRPRRLPYVNESRSTFNLAEILGSGKGDKDCLCSYHCPECGLQAKKHVTFGFRFTFCDECNTKLFLQPAVQGEWGTEDENGNVYVANKIYQAS